MSATLKMTALMAAFVAIPLILQMRRIQFCAARAGSGVRPSDDERRYDTSDFLQAG